MSLKYAIEAYELLDSPSASGESVREALLAAGVSAGQITVKKVEGPKGHTDFIKVWFSGKSGKRGGGPLPPSASWGAWEESAPGRSG